MDFSPLTCPIKMKFILSLRYPLGRFVFEFHKIQIGDDVIVTSFTFSAINSPYFTFYQTNKLHTWYQCTLTIGTYSDQSEIETDAH